MKMFREANGTVYFGSVGVPLDFFLTLAPDYPPVGNGNVRSHGNETRHVVIDGVQQADSLSPDVVDGYLRRSGEFIAAWEAESRGQAVPSDPVESPTAAASPEPEARAEEEAFFLSPTGTYHRETCSRRPGECDLLPLAEIFLHNPAARPCGVCKPPALPA